MFVLEKIQGQGFACLKMWKMGKCHKDEGFMKERIFWQLR